MGAAPRVRLCVESEDLPPTSQGAWLTETGYRVCWGAGRAGRAGSEAPRGGASVLPSRASVLPQGGGWMEGAPGTAVARAAWHLGPQPAGVGPGGHISGRRTREGGRRRLSA